MLNTCKCNILAKEIENSKGHTAEVGTQERKRSPQTEGGKFAVGRVKGGFAPLAKVGSDKPLFDMVCCI